MQATTRRSGVIATGALALCLTTSAALAGEATEREAQLEQRMRELEAQVERLTAVSGSNATTELASRVAELERAVADGGTGLSAYWKQGMRADSAEGDFKFSIGGRTQVDFMFPRVHNDVERYIGSTADPISILEEVEPGAYFRRARLYMAGKIYENVGFKAEYDFAGGDADFSDVYITLNSPCIGLFTVGHHYEPIGLTNLTSDNYITFMERSFVSDLLPERSTGMSLRNSFNEDWGWAIGSFVDSNSYGDDKGNTSSGEWSHTARIAGVAWENPDAQQLLHVGAGGSIRSPSNDTVTFQTRGAQRLTRGYLSKVTLTDMSPDATLWNLEAAFRSGALFADAEFAQADADAKGLPGDGRVQAWHATLGYYLTGEARAYDRKNNVWGRTAPKKNYGKDGSGAVQVALRYDSWSPMEAAGSAPDVDQWTAGIGWYLNPNTRVLLNWTHGEVRGIGGYELLGMRFAVDF